ncbi:MAG: hypothetical protein LLH30_06755 [Candidatus Manganitrophus sp. SA1]|nr:hypothetical protein [Candidatus Manganitrophus morganii]
MFRTLFLLLLLAASFGAGYFLGAAGTTEVKKNYFTLKEEMFSKTRLLEAEVSTMRVRLNLTEARDFLSAAGDEVKRKNFGDAENKTGKAKERITKAISLASETQKKNLTPIQSEIDSIQNAIRKLDPKVLGKIEALEKELGKATG